LREVFDALDKDLKLDRTLKIILKVTHRFKSLEVLNDFLCFFSPKVT